MSATLPGGAVGALPVRVTVEEVWDAIDLELPASTTIAELKRQALDAAHVGREHDLYAVKFRGAFVDDAQTLADVGAVPHAPFIVLSRRRRPVR